MLASAPHDVLPLQSSKKNACQSPLSYGQLPGISSCGCHPCQLMFVGLNLAPSSILFIRTESAQRKIGAEDCGVFALAFLVELLNGGDPAEITYDQRRMRQHLQQCMTTGTWTVFPRSTTKSQQRINNYTIPFKMCSINQAKKHFSDKSHALLWAWHTYISLSPQNVS